MLKEGKLHLYKSPPSLVNNSVDSKYINKENEIQNYINQQRKYIDPQAITVDINIKQSKSALITPNFNIL